MAFLKALDYSWAFRAPDVPAALPAHAATLILERDFLFGIVDGSVVRGLKPQVRAPFWM